MYYSIFHFQIKSNPQFKIPLLEENAVMRNRLVAVILINHHVHTETSNMFLNKHYVVPFVKEYVARFPLLYK